MKKLFLFALFTLLSVSVFCEKTPELLIMTGEFPPLTYTVNGKAAGPSVEIVDYIQKELGTNYPIVFYPWSRGYTLVQETPNSVLFSMTRTKERENKFKWVGPIAQKRFSFFVKKGSKIKIKNLEDAKKYKIGCLFKSNNNEFLVSKKFQKIEESKDELQNAKKLMNGRIQIWYTDTAMMKSALEELKIPESSVEEIFEVQKNESYFGFNLETPDEIIDSWQKVLDKMYKEGKIKEILKKYKLEHLYYNKK